MKPLSIGMLLIAVVLSLVVSFNIDELSTNSADMFTSVLNHPPVTPSGHLDTLPDEKTACAALFFTRSGIPFVLPFAEDGKYPICEVVVWRKGVQWYGIPNPQYKLNEASSVIGTNDVPTNGRALYMSPNL